MECLQSLRDSSEPANPVECLQSSLRRIKGRFSVTHRSTLPPEVKDALQNISVPVIFVIGGPGSGKGTQCVQIVEKYGFTHLSTGDLLRDEVASGSERGKKLNEIMQRGELVPLDQVLLLLKEAIVKHLNDSKGFLLDGYPRELEQAVRFEKEVCPCAYVLFFDVSDDVMTQRLLKRGETSGRVDDNEVTIRSRLATFHKYTQPILDHLGAKVKKICAEGTTDGIFKEVCACIEGK